MPLTSGSFYLHCWAHFIKTVKHSSCAMGFHPLAATKREPASSHSRHHPLNDYYILYMLLNPRTICLESVGKMGRALKTQFTQHILSKIMYIDSRRCTEDVGTCLGETEQSSLHNLNWKLYQLKYFHNKYQPQLILLYLFTTRVFLYILREKAGQFIRVLKATSNRNCSNLLAKIRVAGFV